MRPDPGLLFCWAPDVLMKNPIALAKLFPVEGKANLFPPWYQACLILQYPSQLPGTWNSALPVP